MRGAGARSSRSQELVGNDDFESREEGSGDGSAICLSALAASKTIVLDFMVFVQSPYLSA